MMPWPPMRGQRIFRPRHGLDLRHHVHQRRVGVGPDLLGIVAAVEGRDVALDAAVLKHDGDGHVVALPLGSSQCE
jgi:hypothetical protein